MPSNGRSGPSLARDEAFRVLRSNLTVALADLERPTVVVTSAQASEGKTSIAVHLARSMAAAGQRVVLIDLDLRHADVHNWLGVRNDAGITDVLLGRKAVEDCLQTISVGTGPMQGPRTLYLLTAGPPVDNPTELIGTRRMSTLLDSVAAQADVVVIDTPPVLLVADTLVVGRMAAGALLVAETRRTPLVALQRAKDALIRNQTRLLGVVINKFEVKQAGELEGLFEYGYGDGASVRGDATP